MLQTSIIVSNILWGELYYSRTDSVLKLPDLMSKFRTVAVSVVLLLNPIIGLYIILLLWFHSPSLRLGRFFSSFILCTCGRTPSTGIRPSQGLYLHAEQHKHRINTYNRDIHAVSGIRTHDPSVRTSEDSSCLRPLSHCDRHVHNTPP
jgi:hypothetical protein